MKELLLRILEQEDIMDIPVEPPVGYKFDVTDEVVDSVGQSLGIDFEKIDRDQFKRGLEIEQEHWDVAKTDRNIVGRIALAHIKEIPDYYSRLDKMESEAEGKMAD